MVNSRTTNIGVVLFHSSLFAMSCHLLIYDHSVPYVVVEASSCSPYCFLITNICILFLLKFLPKLQPEPS